MVDTDNIQNVIFVQRESWSRRDQRILGADYLAKKGYDITCVAIIEKESDAVFVPSEAQGKKTEYETILKSKFDEYIQDNKDRTFVFFSNPDEHSVALKKYGIYYIAYGGLGLVCDRYRDTDYLNTHKLNFISKLIKSVKKNKLLFFARAWKRIKEYVNKNIRTYKVGEIQKPYAIVLSTYYDKCFFSDEYLEGRIVYTHSFDYDRFLENERMGITSTEEYIVFIEDGLIGRDRDHEFYGLGNCVNQEKWERECRELFDLLERKYNVPVIVAGHPQSIYNSEKFAGRKIVLGKTTELIPRAKLVVTQISTVFSMIVLYKKDYLFVVDTDVVKQLCSFEEHYIRWYSYFIELMQVRVLDFDRDKHWGNNIDNYINHLDGELGEMYKNRYIKLNNTTDKMNCEVLEDLINCRRV